MTQWWTNYKHKTSDGKTIQATGEHPFYVGDKSNQLDKSIVQKTLGLFTKLKIYFVSGIHVVKMRF